METLSSANLLSLLNELHHNLARYEGEYLTLKEQMESLERELRDRREILDSFALVSETDTRGVITFANRKFCEVSGYSVEELVGKPHNIIRHPDMPKSVFKELWDTIKAGKIWQGEVKNRRKDGSHYWVLATVGPLLDSDGYPYRFVSMRVDITRQKDLEDQLRQERNRLSDELASNLKLAASIQRALLPPTEEKSSPSTLSVPYFALWRPLQEVSGDFFWMHEEKGRLLLFIGDSVGHGIAGSLISTLFIQELRHLVKERGIWSPELLAEELDTRLGQLFYRQLSLPITVDGTIALIDLSRRKLSYLALRGRGVLARGGTLTRLDHFPFSFGDLLGKAARETVLELEPGDRLYFYTDGIYDQEGGPQGRRWGNKQWMEYLRDLQNLPLPAQKQTLLDTLRTWQGETAQTDDILVVGIEIP
uniref:PAS/PAC sensor signal transduction histidine kinase n=1 Tax=uncultured Bacteroidota bacterium TaxID=152509 RepID=H5SMS7_9BACT|nr:PAS/PAC sensor signal transduction histidine kinase [uncultured Bacteroidetes bacterium]